MIKAGGEGLTEFFIDEELTRQEQSFDRRNLDWILPQLPEYSEEGSVKL